MEELALQLANVIAFLPYVALESFQGRLFDIFSNKVHAIRVKVCLITSVFRWEVLNQAFQCRQVPELLEFMREFFEKIRELLFELAFLIHDNIGWIRCMEERIWREMKLGSRRYEMERLSKFTSL